MRLLAHAPVHLLFCFPPPDADLTFDATYIFVHGGVFRAGTEELPFLNQLTITLHGDRYNTLGERGWQVCRT